MRDISQVLHSKPPKRSQIVGDDQIVDFVDMIQASWEMSGLKPFEGKGTVEFSFDWVYHYRRDIRPSRAVLLWQRLAREIEKREFLVRGGRKLACAGAVLRTTPIMSAPRAEFTFKGD